MQLDPKFDSQVTRLDAEQAAALVDSGATVLDVRTPDEFTGLGHIPGARLLPVHLSASAPAVLEDSDRPLLVCCEHAVRSRVASRLLAQAGFTAVHELATGMAGWRGPRAFDLEPMTGPSPWLVDNVELLPGSGRVLDVACGKGRHALLLAAAGFAVTAVDRDPAALERLRGQAHRLELDVRVEAVDLEGPVVDLGQAVYDLIVVVRYLHRPLFPRLIDALAPGGALVCETFLAGQAERGHPRNPAFLLEPGELLRLVHPLEVLRSREGDFDGAMLASVVARRTPIPA
jgi:rhodanese-related sulfurtransferase